MKKILIIIVGIFFINYSFTQDFKEKPIIGNNFWQPIDANSEHIDINSGFEQGYGRVDCIAISNETPSTIYITSPGGGIWKTTNSGNDWQPKADNLETTSFSWIVINPENENILYASTGNRNLKITYSKGVYKSTNGGQNWFLTGLHYDFSEQKNINSLIINPLNPDILFAGTTEGIMKSTDAGLNWFSVFAGAEIQDMEIVYNDNQVFIYATSFNKNGSVSIYKSENSGESFIISNPDNFPTNEISRIELAVNQNYNNLIYAICVDKNTKSMSKLYKSDDRADSWEEILDSQKTDLLSHSSLGEISVGEANSNIAIMISSSNPNVIFVGGTHLWKSNDGGNNFELLKNCFENTENNVIAGHHYLVEKNNEIFLASDGGIYKSNNNGETWENISSNISIMQSLNVDFSELASQMILSSNLFTKPLLIKEEGEFSIFSEKSGFSIIDYSDANIFYVSTFNGKLFKTEDGGYTFVEITPFGDEVYEKINPIAIDKNNPNIIYYGSISLYISENKGETWRILNESRSWNTPIEQINLSSSSENIFYISTYNEIWKTEDGGKSWDSILLRNLDENIELSNTINKDFFIEIDYNNPKLIWVAKSGFGNQEKLLKSEDGGITWQDLTNNFPEELNIRCIVNQLQTKGNIYAGTNAGVYYFDKLSETWIKYNDSLPNVPVNYLKINYQTNKLIASTLGRGIWEVDLFSIENLEPTANFTSDNFTPCLFDEIQLFDLSTYSPDNWTWEIFPDFYEFAEESNQYSQNPKIYFTQNGVYSITLTVNNEFGSSSTIKTNFIFAGKPFSNFNFTINDYNVNFQNNSFNASQYFWEFGDNETSTLKNPIHIYEKPGIYTTKLTVTNNCGNDFTNKNIIINSLKIQEAEIENVIIYPNPSNGEVNIFSKNGQSEIRYYIYEISGKEIKSGNLANNFIEKVYLEKGIYILIIENDFEKISNKIIIN